MINYKIKIKGTDKAILLTAKNEAELKLLVKRIYGVNVQYSFTKI